MLIENSMLQNAHVMMCTSAGEKEISTNKVCRVVQWITYKTRQFPKVIDWITAAQSATIILPET